MSILSRTFSSSRPPPLPLHRLAPLRMQLFTPLIVYFGSQSGAVLETGVQSLDWLWRMPLPPPPPSAPCCRCRCHPTTGLLLSTGLGAESSIPFPARTGIFPSPANRGLEVPQRRDERRGLRRR